MTERKYRIPETIDGLTPAVLKRMRKSDQLEVMRGWFHEHYDSPEENTPYDSEEGGYIWIWGGPHEPKDVLEQEFGGVVAEKFIQELAEELESVSYEWSGKPEYDDYDEHLYEVVKANVAPATTFKNAVATVTALLGITMPGDLAAAQHRLLLANIITALETYFFDTFTNAVMSDDARLRVFLETNPDFQKQTVRFSDVLSQAASVKERAKAYLLDVVWHNLAKVQAMYTSTFGVKFGASLAPIARSIETRHDIVHRNGISKTGSPVHVGESDVRSLADAAMTLVVDIEKGMSQPDPVGDPF
jgi:enamine deaminase RidA (YjgF/YER057c/UK114 family)